MIFVESVPVFISFFKQVPKWRIIYHNAFTPTTINRIKCIRSLEYIRNTEYTNNDYSYLFISNIALIGTKGSDYLSADRNNSMEENNNTLLVIVVAFPLAAVIIFLITISGIMIQSGIDGAGKSIKISETEQITVPIETPGVVDGSNHGVTQANTMPDSFEIPSDRAPIASDYQGVSDVGASQEQGNNSDGYKDTSSNLNSTGDLYELLLGKPYSKVREVLGKSSSPFGGQGLAYKEGTVTVDVAEDKVYFIELHEGSNYTLLGFKPGDSAKDVEQTLTEKYGAKGYVEDVDLYYMSVDDNVMRVSFERSDDGLIRRISFELDILGIFEAPKDMSGMNMFEFNEEIEDPMVDDIPYP